MKNVIIFEEGDMFYRKVFWFLIIFVSCLMVGRISYAEGVSEVPSAVDSDTVTAKGIYVSCNKYFDRTFNTRENVARKAACNGYFFGVTSTLLTLLSMSPSTDICLPNDISTEQVIRDFIAWGGMSKPEDLLVPATVGAMTALIVKYPCG